MVKQSGYWWWLVLVAMALAEAQGDVVALGWRKRQVDLMVWGGWMCWRSLKLLCHYLWSPELIKFDHDSIQFDSIQSINQCSISSI